MRRDPYDKAIAAPTINVHPIAKNYKWAFKYKSELPNKALYLISKVVGTSKMKGDLKEMKQYIAQCKSMANQFAYFMNNEWIFDNPSARIL